MEALIVLVGFLGAGKTTLLKRLVTDYLDAGWQPFVILNDYENAHMDAQQLHPRIGPQGLTPMDGNCICCTGITELRANVNRIPERDYGITLIEANGTVDACDLMEFLGVGIDERFRPPVQVSVVDVRNWQLREEHNELEAHQVKVSSLILLSHYEDVAEDRVTEVRQALAALNPGAKILSTEQVDIEAIPELAPSTQQPEKYAHDKAQWASCSVDLPDLPTIDCVIDICNALPDSLLRVKGFTKLAGQSVDTYFERTPSGEVSIRTFNGNAMTGAKLLTVGRGSDPDLLKQVIADSLAAAERQAS